MPNSNEEDTKSENLFDETTEKIEKIKVPSYLKVTIANLVCPGYGTWLTGEKFRGFAVFLILMVFLLTYMLEIRELVQTNSTKIRSALLSGNQKKLELAIGKLVADLTNNSNLELFFYGYIFSMIDSIYLVYNKKKKNKL